MRLKRLELSGFKSFAKNTVLEFPTPVSAVVGPNGSGKSNVADAIRWVLGEQSLKTLRGKRGEDLIFNGSHTAPRMSKASVVLAFDNSKKEFPLEFDEVQIGRLVYRDGQNEYLLNDSKVRLKDIIELLASVGFGSSQHHIISQGEADRILYASPKERREMIEDALGLKIFQIKRLEAERKLERTKENISDVERLRREIQPHLKFLKLQAEKYELAAKLRDELREALTEYLARMSSTLRARFRAVAASRKEPERTLKKREAEIAELREKLEKDAGRGGRLAKEEDGQDTAKKLADMREARVSIEREAGRLEGILSLQEKRAREGGDVPIPRREVEKALQNILASIDNIRLGAALGLESVLAKIKELHAHVAAFLLKVKGKKETGHGDVAEYAATLKKLKGELEELKREEEKLAHAYEAERAKGRGEADELRGIARELYEREREAGRVRESVRSLDFEEEKIHLSQREFKREVEEAKIYLGFPAVKETEPFVSDAEAEAAKKKADRLKIKLEEAGGIDPDTIKEYNVVEERDEFLAREIGDLVSSSASLRQVMAELEKKLTSEFEDGTERINAEFQNFFAVMFGGGKAGLKVVKPKKRRKHDEDGEDDQNGENDEEAELQEGIEISVDLPRKKIRSLDMLSGGERALTSIALLFAMSAVHPPPFLVLDETDAALDEANSQRYAKMLTDLSRTTQLVVITHNRTTMKCAGVLYGVTMGQGGVSKLLSIRFEEVDLLVSR